MGASASPIRHTRYAPDFTIRINGGDLPKSVRGSITSVRFEDGIQRADRVEIAIANTDLRFLQKHIKGLGFQPFPTGVRIGPVSASAVPAGVFDVANTLSLALGYAPGTLSDVFLGEVTGVQASFPSSGTPTLTLVAHDYLQRLSPGSAARGFGPLPDFVVAAILAAENMLIPLIDPTLGAISTAMAAAGTLFSGTGIKQKGQSDLQLLDEIARRYDAEYWVEGTTLHVSRLLKEYTPRLTLTWGESLIDFAPQVSTIGSVAGVSMKFTLREIPMDFLVTAGWDFDRESLSISVVPGQAAGGSSGSGPSFTIMDQPITSPADIANSALTIVRELRRRLNSRLTATANTIGDPRIAAGALVRVEGIGPDFSGDYRVRSATHTIDGGGYRTSCQLYKEIIP
jgi:phage protein D